MAIDIPWSMLSYSATLDLTKTFLCIQVGQLPLPIPKPTRRLVLCARDFF